MTENFNSIIKNLELEIYDKESYLNHFLESTKRIDEMDYNEFMEWTDNEIEEDYRNKFICEWKDYAFLRGKLQTANQLKDIVEKAIDREMKMFQGRNTDKSRLVYEVLENMRKSIFGGNA